MCSVIDAKADRHKKTGERDRIEIDRPKCHQTKHPHVDGADAEHCADDADEAADENAADGRHAQQRRPDCEQRDIFR